MCIISYVRTSCTGSSYSSTGSTRMSLRTAHTTKYLVGDLDFVHRFNSTRSVFFFRHHHNEITQDGEFASGGGCSFSRPRALFLRDDRRRNIYCILVHRETNTCRPLLLLLLCSVAAAVRVRSTYYSWCCVSRFSSSSSVVCDGTTPPVVVVVLLVAADNSEYHVLTTFSNQSGTHCRRA